MPRFPGERPLGGRAAFESLDGRGWDQGYHLSRHPVIALLNQLEAEADSVASAGQPSFRVGDLIATHIQALTHGMGGSRVVSVPDTLAEMGQQRLLDGLRHLGIGAELLWRPVATILGWACRQPDHLIRALHGTSVMVVHVGVWRPEVSVLDLEVEEHANRPFLVPVRHGKGAGLEQSAWPLESLAKAALTADLGRAELPVSLAESLLWISRRPWSFLCGDAVADEIVRDVEGRWHRVKGQGELEAEMEGHVLYPLAALLKHISAAQRVARVLVDGALVNLSLDRGTLGSLLVDEARRLTGCHPEAVESFAAQACLSANGAAHYGWRRASGVVGYYDTIPDLKINALVEQRPAFISLMEGQKRVIGGKAIEPPLEVSGFSIAKGTAAVDYYLTRADEPTARKTHTVLPEEARRTTPVTLVVTQTPGQGFASVEIRPPRGKHP